jgi:hypothetical protein
MKASMEKRADSMERKVEVKRKERFFMVSTPFR